MKRGLALFSVSIILILSISLVSASWFSDFWNGVQEKIDARYTGKAVEKSYTSIDKPVVSTGWGSSVPVCSDSASMNQFCMLNGYDGGEIGASYSGGQCAQYRSSDGTWLSSSSTLYSARCYTIEEPIISVYHPAYPNSSINFGYRLFGQYSQESIQITNIGLGTLSGSASVSGTGFSCIQGCSYSLSSGQSQMAVIKFSPTAKQSYNGVVTLTGGGGAQIPVKGEGDILPTITFSASPASITVGNSSTLSWISNAVNCNKWWGDSGSAAINPSGNERVYPQTTTSYTLACFSLGGFGATKSAVVTVLPSSEKSSSAPTAESTEPLADPAISITANPPSINLGESSILTWDAKNVESCTATGAWSGEKPTSGFTRVSPTLTSIYTLNCTKSDGKKIVNYTTVSVNSGDNSVGCTDSDGGKNYYMKGIGQGIIVLANGAEVLSEPQTDSCRPIAANVSTSVNEYYCDEKYLKSEIVNCPNGCLDGACVEEEKLKEYKDCKNGCKLNGKCYKYNDRQNRNYCDMEGRWLPQKQIGAACSNDFECLNNLCSAGQCSSNIDDLALRIREWLRNIFG